jgi:excisionase family DNA binding protein
MSDLVAIPLPDGKWIALAPDSLRAALAAAAAMGLGVQTVAALASKQTEPERWIDSRELAALTGIGDTTLEAWAKNGRVPAIRAGKALRFKASEVERALRESKR